MKKKAFHIYIALMTLVLTFGCSSEMARHEDNIIESDSAPYQLFPTKNFWTFIKLDTRNGKMWQVHFTVDSDEGHGNVVLNANSLIDNEDEVTGRFTLYPTENIYNFLLLDKKEGNVFQVQWSMDMETRFIMPIK